MSAVFLYEIHTMVFGSFIGAGVASFVWGDIGVAIAMLLIAFVFLLFVPKNKKEPLPLSAGGETK